jgi:hypothetical protein
MWSHKDEHLEQDARNIYETYNNGQITHPTPDDRLEKAMKVLPVGK